LLHGAAGEPSLEQKEMSMNAPFTPVDNYADLGALLRLLVDPAATKQRLDELIAQQAATRAEIETLNAMASETKRLHNTAQATNIVLQRREAALDAREAEADAREARLDQSEATRSDANLRHRESAAEAKEEALKREADRLAAMRADYQAKLEKLKGFTATLR
jgi:hypothetical protein